MNKNNTNQITDSNQRAESKTEAQFSKHLHETHRIFVQSLNPRLKSFFDGLNDFFFDMAEKAETNAIQNQYFAAIGDTRKNKTELTRQFVKNVNVIFQKFKSHDHVYFIENAEQTEETKRTLTLIKEDDLDQKLAINNVIAKISQIYHEDLYLLNERFAEIADEAEITNNSNPIGPDAIVNAFALSLKVLKSENNVKLMIIKLFEKNMVESLGPAYRMVNKYFKKQKILPEIKFEVKHKPVAGNHINNSINYLAHALSETDDNYKKIANILDHDREQVSHEANYSPENIVQFSQLSDALDQIKVELLSDHELEAQQSISPLELKDELLRKLKELKALTKQNQITAADENTIDLIGQLFQFLVEDRNLPETIQLVLSKLQLPYLQIALKDETFFSDKHNNARQLLNIMAQASIGWSREFDEKGLFLNKIKEIVGFILKNHEKNINYEKLIERFIQFDQQLKKRSVIAERRTTEKMSGRERLNHAKVKSAEVLKKHLKGQKVPSLVREVLLKPWANVLILSELRQKESPEELQKHQDFVRRLVNAANPNNHDKRSKAALKAICEELAEGLKLVAFEPQELREKTAQMMACLSKINGLKSSREPIDFIAPAEILKLSKEFNKESSVGEYIKNPDKNFKPPTRIKLINDAYQETAENIKLGDWLEIKKGKKRMRVKLSWISPISGKLLLVNAKGAKVVDLFPVELAHRLRKKQFVTLQQVPLIDRAMSSIADKMASQTAKQAEQ